jgi:uncharacterized protein YjbI with pentapeptide repeats
MAAQRAMPPAGARAEPEIDDERLADWADAGLARGFAIEDARIGRVDGLAGLDATGGRIGHSRLAGTALTGSRLRSLSLIDATLTGVDAANADWTGARLRRVVFERCRMTGFAAAELDAEDVEFRGCKLDLASFRAARLRQVSFLDCVLDEADLAGAQLIDARFAGSQIARAELGGVRLTRVDLRGARLEEPRGDVTALRGAIIDPVQLVGLAGVLAAGLGIVVAD